MLEAAPWRSTADGLNMEYFCEERTDGSVGKFSILLGRFISYTSRWVKLSICLSKAGGASWRAAGCSGVLDRRVNSCIGVPVCVWGREAVTSLRD